MLFRCEVIAITKKMLTPVCWEGWQHPAITPARKCKYFRMQKIDVTPSVEMLRACFRSEIFFSVYYKGGINILAEPTVGTMGWKLTRFKNGKQTSWLELGMDETKEDLHLKVNSDEVIIAEIARGAWQYQNRQDEFAVFLVQVLALYGGKTGDITSVER